MSPLSQSLRPNRRVANFRAGVSLIEVTFAIGIVVVGLLGVIALLPLAAHQARQSDITDRAAVLGLSAVEEFDMRGYRRPDMWLVWSPFPSRNEFTPFVPGPGYRRWSVFNQAAGGFVGLDSLDGSTFPGGYSNPNTVDRGMVQSFCIDPQFINANLANLVAPSGVNHPRFFPYYLPTHPSTMGTFVPRMTRITVKAFPNQNRVVSYAQAAKIFTSADDLAIEFPQDEDQLSYVNGFNEGADGGWGVAFIDDDGDTIVDEYDEAGFAGSDDEIIHRYSSGEYSWMATLTPKLDIKDSLRFSGEYTLSIVVFHQRDSSMTMDDKNENVANVAAFYNGGYGGGEVLLEAVDTDEDEHVFGELRPGDWVMLSADSFAGPVFRWYRISSADSEQSRQASVLGYNGGNDVWTRRVTLEGPDWARPEWQGSPPAFRTQCVLVSGVVAVYEKTVRLESTSLWNQ